MTRPLRVGAPTLQYGDDGMVYLSAIFTKGDFNGSMWLRAKSETAQYFDPKTADAFFLPSLLMSMEAGTDLEFDAPISDLLYYNVSKHVPAVLKVQSPRLRIPKVIVPETIENRKNPVGVGTGLSGGVDSFAAVYNHYLNNPPSSTKLTHLCQFSHAQKRGVNNGWEKRLVRHRDTAAALELPLVEIGTNFSLLTKLPHTMSHTYLNCSCVLALDSLFSKYFYASTFQYRDIFVSETNDIAHADPVVLPLISNENVRFFSTGSETARTTKTGYLADVPQAEARLDVCTKSLPGKINCSACYKCMRTMITLDMLDIVDRYEAVFDLEKYHSRRGGFARAILKTTSNPYMIEIREMPDAVAKLKNWSRIDRMERAAREEALQAENEGSATDDDDRHDGARNAL